MDCKTKFGCFMLVFHMLNVVSLISQIFTYYRVPQPYVSTDITEQLDVPISRVLIDDYHRPCLMQEVD